MRLILITLILNISISSFGINKLSQVDLNSFSIKLSGILDNRKITIFLNQKSNDIKGLYYYNSNKYYLKLLGKLDEKHQLILSEYNSKGSNTGIFKLNIEKHDLIGFWEKPDQSNTYPLTLKILKGDFENVINDSEIIAQNDSSKIVKSKPFFDLKEILILLVVILTLYLKYFYRKMNWKRLFDGETYYKPNNVEIEKSVAIGRAFEEFIAGRFASKNITIEVAQSDKKFADKFVESNKNPDFIFRLNTKSGSTRFAIECKYRSQLNQDSKVRLCEDYQLKNYQSFSEKEKIKVFLVLGLFDTPSNPRYIYVIPIEQIRSHIIEFNDLERYLRRKPVSQQFFFNPESGMLS